MVQSYGPLHDREFNAENRQYRYSGGVILLTAYVRGMGLSEFQVDQYSSSVGKPTNIAPQVGGRVVDSTCGRICAERPSCLQNAGLRSVNHRV
jgi:hypothetical protein